MSAPEWIEGSWNAQMGPVGLPKDVPGEPDNYVWIVVEHRFCWGMLHVGPTHGMTSLLRSVAAFNQANNSPLGRWAWRHAEKAPDLPPFKGDLAAIPVPSPCPLSIPLNPHNGHLDPAYFVAVHKSRIERLEAALALVTRLADISDIPYVLREEMGELLWGVPCAGCGCAETLCCCAQDETP